MKNISKKLVAVVSAVVSVVLVVSLVLTLGPQRNSEKSIQSSVTSAMKAIKKYKVKTINKKVDSDAFKAIEENLDLLENGDQLLKNLFTELEFEVGEIIVNKDSNQEGVSATATCDVTITNRDLQVDASTYLIQTISYLKADTVDITDKEYQKNEVARIVEKLKSEETKTKQSKVVFNLEKRKGKWIVILSGSSESAVFGGTAAPIKTILSYINRAKNGTLNFGMANTTSPEQKTSEHPTTPVAE